MVARLLGNTAHVRRARQLAEVLAKHGLGYLISILGLDQYIRFRVGHGRSHSETPPAHLRATLEEMGVTFIKLGQILSTRADLLPPAYQTELAKLQDQAAPVAWEIIRDCLTEELGRPVESAFADFDPVPIAAASIGQVHAAVLRDGTEVVVKVRRPGVVEQVEEDLGLLETLAESAARRWELADKYDVVGLARGFAETLRQELDYVQEAQNAERFARNFEDDPSVHIPRVYHETSTARVLTLERIRGVKVDQIDALNCSIKDRNALAERATLVILKMIFEDGFFHADPHPGNFFIEPAGRIGLVDFGMVGAIDEATQQHLAEMLEAVTSRSSERLADALLELGLTKSRVDRDTLRRDLDHLLSRYYGRAIGEIRIGPLVNDIFSIVRKHHLHLPANLALLLKTVVMAESAGVRVDPDFHITSALVPYVERLVLRRYSPTAWGRRLGRASLELARLGADLPQQLRRVIGEVEQGSIQVGVRPEGFDPVLRRIERLANRIVIGVIAAAFINGLAVLVSVYRPPGWESWGWIAFAAGFIAAVMLGLYLVFSMLRPGRRL